MPLFLAALFYLPQAAWALFLMAWLLVAAWEWATLAGWSEPARAKYLCVMGSLGVLTWLLVVVPVRTGAEMFIYFLALIFWLAVVPLWMARGLRIHHAAVLALAGLVFLLPLWLAMVKLQSEPRVLLGLLAILWISDTAAFASGKCWGRRKLAPVISPGKTWEGFFGALTGVALYYVVWGWSGISDHPMLSGVSGLVVFLGLAVLGVEGDLFESWIKRTAGVKDSGTILPGHGGILDRVDALTSSIPLAALLLAWYR